MFLCERKLFGLKKLGFIQLIAAGQAGIFPTIDQAPVFLFAVLDGIALEAVSDHIDLLVAFSFQCLGTGRTTLTTGAAHQDDRAILAQLAYGERFENIELSPIRDAGGEITYFMEKIDPLPVPRTDEHARGLIGRSPAFLTMLDLVARVPPADAAVLLQGESGTGKELVANAIHQLSRRVEKPFVAVDCSGLAETLFESELFGHERGAFTGAVTRKIGLIEAASGGTLFLDEVGDIPLSIQVKLLRLLETGTFRRVGSTELRQADIRVISATHRPLAEMVEAGTFRQDLFYRLNVFPIFLPPLRARGDDIVVLVEALLPQVSNGRHVKITDQALGWLRDYPFPGNVRELRNLLERACLLSDNDEIDLRHLPTSAASHLLRSTPKIAEKQQLTDEELLALLHRFPGSRKALAGHLQLSERTLYRRLKSLVT